MVARLATSPYPDAAPVARGWPVVAFLALVGLLAALQWLHGYADTDRYAYWRHESDFIAKQERLGYHLMGRFGRVRFPAVVVDRVDGSGGIVFHVPNGNVHEYDHPAYADSAFKALTLRPRRPVGPPFVLLFRRPLAETSALRRN